VESSPKFGCVAVYDYDFIALKAPVWAPGRKAILAAEIQQNLGNLLIFVLLARLLDDLLAVMALDAAGVVLQVLHTRILLSCIEPLAANRTMAHFLHDGGVVNIVGYFTYGAEPFPAHVEIPVNHRAVTSLADEARVVIIIPFSIVNCAAFNWPMANSTRM